MTTRTGARSWPDDVRDRTLTVYTDQGLAAAARTTGVPKSTIRRWAAAAGVTHDTARAAAQTREATAAALVANEFNAAKAAELHLQAAAQNGLLAAQLERMILDAAVAVAREAKESVLGSASGAALGRLSAAMAGPRLTEVVGARTRAVHDMRLLSGEATETADGQVEVVFTTPAPEALGRPDLRVVDLPPVREVAG